MEPFKQLGLEMALVVLKDNQRQFLEKLDHLNTDPDTLARYGVALQIEVSEFVNELPWKVWKRKDPDVDRVVDEFADVLAFLGTWVNLLGLMGISPTRLALAYAEKTRVNQARIIDGTVPGYGNPTNGYAQSALPPAGIQVRIPAAVTLSPEATLEASIPEPRDFRAESRAARRIQDAIKTVVDDLAPDGKPWESIHRTTTGRMSASNPPVSAVPRSIPDVMDLAGGLEEDRELDPLYDSVATLDDDDDEDLR